MPFFIPEFYRLYSLPDLVRRHNRFVQSGRVLDASQCFDAILHTHLTPRMKSIVYRTPRPEDREDLLSEAQGKLWKSLLDSAGHPQSLPVDRPLVPLARCIANQVLIQHARRNSYAVRCQITEWVRYRIDRLEGCDWVIFRNAAGQRFLARAHWEGRSATKKSTDELLESAQRAWDDLKCTRQARAICYVELVEALLVAADAPIPTEVAFGILCAAVGGEIRLVSEEAAWDQKAGGDRPVEDVVVWAEEFRAGLQQTWDCVRELGVTTRTAWLLTAWSDLAGLGPTSFAYVATVFGVTNPGELERVTGLAPHLVRRLTDGPSVADLRQRPEAMVPAVWTAAALDKAPRPFTDAEAASVLGISVAALQQRKCDAKRAINKSNGDPPAAAPPRPSRRTGPPIL